MGVEGGRRFKEGVFEGEEGRGGTGRTGGTVGGLWETED